MQQWIQSTFKSPTSLTVTALLKIVSFPICPKIQSNLWPVSIYTWIKQVTYFQHKNDIQLGFLFQKREALSHLPVRVLLFFWKLLTIIFHSSFLSAFCLPTLHQNDPLSFALLATTPNSPISPPTNQYQVSMNCMVGFIPEIAPFLDTNLLY